MSDTCEYAALIAVGGTVEEECSNEAEFDLAVKAGSYNREFSICAEHAEYMMRTAAPAASEITLEGDTTTLVIQRDELLK